MRKYVWILLLWSLNARAADLPPLLVWYSGEHDVTYRIYMSEIPGAQANGEVFEMGADHSAYVPELPLGEPRFFCATAVRNGLESECSREVGYIRPHVQVSPIDQGVMFFFHRITSPGSLRYTLEVSEDLKDWTDELPVEPKTAVKNGVEVQWIELDRSLPHLFSRIRVERGE